VLILALTLCLLGFALLRIGVRWGRRNGLLSSAFWITFPEFARYRRKRVWPALLALAGAILSIWGLVLLFQWILTYYAARLGHPLN
jgi:hypothetical protein